MTYSEKLQDPRWQKKRLGVLNYAEWRCQLCGDSKKTLHVHHSFYDGRDPWEYPNGSLSCLCSSCHENRHGKSDSKAPVRPRPVIPVPGFAKSDFAGQAFYEYSQNMARFLNDDTCLWLRGKINARKTALLESEEGDNTKASRAQMYRIHHLVRLIRKRIIPVSKTAL